MGDRPYLATEKSAHSGNRRLRFCVKLRNLEVFLKIDTWKLV